MDLEARAAFLQEQYKKRLLVLRAKLSSAKYYRALLALEFAHFHHGPRFRKDKITPEFDHQVEICLHLMTLPDLIDMEGAIVTALLHDVPEDFFITEAEIVSIFRPKDRDFAIEVARSAELLNKYNRDRTLKDSAPMWEAIANDVRASIVKPGDRIHNLGTMNTLKECGEPVFGFAKQADYADYAEDYVLPMMKKARHIFPEQENAYLNMKWLLQQQIRLIRSMIGHVERASSSAKVIEIIARA